MNQYKYTGWKPAHISASQISIAKCLYKYMILYLKKEISYHNKQMEKGSLIHDAIFRYTDYAIKNRVESDYEELNKIIDEVYKKYDLEEKDYREARETILNFGEKGIEFSKILDYEKREEIEFAPGRKIQLVIDRTNSYRDNNYGSVLEIIDYKNQMNIMTKIDVENDEQLSIYKFIGCTFLYPHYDYVRSGIWHTRYNFCRWTDYQKIKDLNKDFENILKYLNRQWDRIIENDIYHPKKCSACWEWGGCAVMLENKCPLYTKEEIDRMKKIDIENKVRAIRKLSIDIKKLTNEIRNYFKIKPIQIIDGIRTGYESNISYGYMLDKYIDYCKKYNIPLQNLTISKTDAEKAINRIFSIRKMNEKQLKELEKIRIEKGSSKFLI